MLRRNNRQLEKEIKKVHVTVNPLNITQFVEMIDTQPGFSFARISDGGFFCLQGRKGVNCDNSPYSKAQAIALEAMLRDKSITHGITSIALHTTRAGEWLQEKGIEVDFYDADVMNKASDTGNLLPFIECLRKRKSLLVGSLHLSALRGFPIKKFIPCHPTQAFEEVDELESEIDYQLNEHIDTILLSAGQGASPTLVSRLHASYPELTIIDTGSIWDPYVHVFSRSGHKKRGWEGYKSWAG